MLALVLALGVRERGTVAALVAVREGIRPPMFLEPDTLVAGWLPKPPPLPLAEVSIYAFLMSLYI